MVSDPGTTWRKLLAWAVLATIVCPNGQALITWGEWPKEDPCPTASGVAVWLQKCGYSGTSGTPVMTGNEPCPKDATNDR